MTDSWRSLSPRRTARLRGDDEFRLFDGWTRGRTVHVRSADDTRINTEVFGPEHGYPIVLCHGFCCGIRFWSNQIRDLAEDYRVIAFDQRGHGFSESPAREAHTMECLADDLAAVLRSTLRPGERALIAGHSMGGIAIQHWANHYPRDVARYADSIALINTAPGGPLDDAMASGLRDRLTALAKPAGDLLLEGLLGAPIPARVPFGTGFLSPGSEAGPGVRALINELVMTTPATTRRHFIHTLLRLRIDQIDRSRLTAPVLVIESTDDRLVPPPHARRLRELLPNYLGSVRLPGGHCGPLEQPSTVTTALRGLALPAREANSV
ncbi:alpha/beta fold hydrolase [Nocardia sp. NPDC056100]|uniref:alpha/beta fold hydrolase n=1 Tax=Nocardia sp. NPDC056100 TaxID=3345712 RepID=UPI0035D8B863